MHLPSEGSEQQEWLVYSDRILCFSHCSKYFIYTTSLTSHSSLWVGTNIIPVCKWEKWGSERYSDLLKVSQVGNQDSKAGTLIRAFSLLTMTEMCVVRVPEWHGALCAKNLGWIFTGYLTSPGESLFCLGYNNTQASPQWLSGKESYCNVGDTGSIPGSGRSRGGGNGNSLQYSCLGNPMDRGAWQAAVHGVAKESDMSEQLSARTHGKRTGWRREARLTIAVEEWWGQISQLLVLRPFPLSLFSFSLHHPLPASPLPVSPPLSGKELKCFVWK